MAKGAVLHTQERAEDFGFRFQQVYTAGETYGQVTLSRAGWKRVFPTREVADDFLDGFELGWDARDKKQ